MKSRKRIAFFVKERMDNFINPIIQSLTYDYEIQKILVHDCRQIDEAMNWADICWFEWCDDLIVYGSSQRIAEEKKIICRLHSYEAFTTFPLGVNWDNVDMLIFVAEHIRRTVLKITDNRPKITIVIPNGVDLKKYEFMERRPGFNIAYAGYINYKKGPMLLLHTINAIVKRDKRYRLYLAGQFQDPRDFLYFNQMIDELNLKENVIYEGWQNNIDKWLGDKNYIICTSILESQCMSVMEAMCKGIKPLVHNFVGAREIYGNKYIWNTIDEAVDMVVSNEYDSKEYRGFIENNYEYNGQMDRIMKILKVL